MAARSKSSGTTVDLTPREQKTVEDRIPPRAAVVFETIRREGEAELDRTPISLFASGLAAGLAMGMSLAGEGIIRTMLPHATWRPLVDSAGYTLGFLIVILGRQQLFTENTLTAILPLLDDARHLRTLGRVARLWLAVLVANLLGAAIFAYVAADTSAFLPAVKATFSTIGHEALAPGFGLLCLRGVFAGWLIALMVWLLPGAENSRLFVIIIITYIVGVAGFSHVIAGSVDVMYLVARGEIGFGTYVGGFLVPVFIGNVLGGTSLVALLNYGQVALDTDRERAKA